MSYLGCAPSESEAGLSLGQCSWVLQHSTQHNFPHPTSQIFGVIDRSSVPFSSEIYFIYILYIFLRLYFGWRTAGEELLLAAQCFIVSQKLLWVTLIYLATNCQTTAAATWTAEPPLQLGLVKGMSRGGMGSWEQESLQPSQADHHHWWVRALWSNS